MELDGEAEKTAVVLGDLGVPLSVINRTDRNRHEEGANSAVRL